MKKSILVVTLLASTCVSAQQVPPASEQALGAKLMQEIQGGLNCSASLITVQAELAKTQARIKELETKPEKPKE